MALDRTHTSAKDADPESIVTVKQTAGITRSQCRRYDWTHTYKPSMAGYRTSWRTFAIFVSFCSDFLIKMHL